MSLTRAALNHAARAVEFRLALLCLVLAGLTVWISDQAFSVGIQGALRYLALVLTTTAFAQWVLSHVADLLDEPDLAGTAVMGGISSLTLAGILGFIALLA